MNRRLACLTLILQPLPQPQQPPPPPNGGLLAWLHVHGGFALFLNTWGLLNTFGVFQTYFATSHPSTSPSAIAWIGSTQATLLLLIGAITGPIYDRGHLRSLLVSGTSCIFLGHIFLRLSTEYYQVLLSQGILIGLGAGSLFVPCVSVLPSYFSTHLGLALGLAVSGSAAGGIMYPILLYRPLPRVGFAWSVRIMGFVSLATLALPLAVMQQRTKPPRARALLDRAALRDPHYCLCVGASLLAFMGLKLAFDIVPILNAASCFGRTVPNALADCVGPLNLIAPCCLVVAGCLFTMVGVDGVAGFFSGALIGLPPLSLVCLTKERAMIGTRMGMGFGVIGLGVLAGGPGGGAILGDGSEKLDWTGLWVFGGVSAGVGGLFYAILRWLRGGWG
ncbi:MFS general substrate transporter [Aspergillus japonicus CBS 114.51]|uniref:MFS general substrate transporter n=1 Tax=Aspergillus japonicus CBS 114.51 TaxID=1448312 RepID=A0A8T8WJE7_ASPJA|nr:MFS general substrate transporter [Aspergillus japonicus CBS 114.51]RAH75935.1 MFS general substrate transporter [Aspergillus japonicus CBS 114.51]